MPAKDWKYERPLNGWGNAAVICAVLALVVGLVPVMGDLVALPLAIAAAGCGVRGLQRADDGLATNGRTALAGLLLGLVAGLLSFLTLLAVIAS